MFGSLLVILLSVFFLVEGVSQIVIGIKTRKENSMWFLSLIVGILCVILGIISLLHPGFAAVLEGVLIGVAIIMVGISLISFGINGGQEEA